MENFTNKTPVLVSVVVPAYNCESSIAATVASLQSQTLPAEQLEIVLVNDGSTDDTLAVCERLAAADPRIVVIDKPNGGVGSARNAGIEAAHGTYIAFLDGDDTLLPETLEAAAAFFDAHSHEIDLVTYPMILFNEQREWHHVREKVLTETGVYDLTKLQFAFALITNVNVLVKNNADLPRFREDLLVHEDEVFFMQVLLEKQKVGFSKAGGYRYYQHPGSAIGTKMHPLCQFEKNIGFWEELFARYTHGGATKAPLYLQASYLNEVNWKIRQDVFFPYHYDKERFNEALRRIAALMAQVDDDVIFTSPRADEFYRHYLLSLKANARVGCAVDENGFVLRDAGSFDETCDAGMSNDEAFDRESLCEGCDAGTFLLCRRFAACEIFKTRLADGGLLIEGVVRSLILEHAPQARLGFSIGDAAAQYARLEPTSYDYHTGKTRTNRFGKFRVIVPVRENGSVSFWVDVDGARLPLRLVFSHRANLGEEAGVTAFSCGNVLVSLEGHTLRIRAHASKLATFGAWAKNTQRTRKNDPKMLKRRLYAALKKPLRETWLYYDAPARSAIAGTTAAVGTASASGASAKGVAIDGASGRLGNAFYQFVHDVQQDDSVQRLYVAQESPSSLRSLLPPEQAQGVIAFKSKEHRYAHLNASKIITSSLTHGHWCPFSKKNMQGLADVAQYQLIYLPSETDAAHEPWKRAEDRLLADLVVAASPWEAETLSQVYGYAQSQIQVCGKPRFDTMAQPAGRSVNAPGQPAIEAAAASAADDVAAPAAGANARPVRRILLAPTWRSYLVSRLPKNEFAAKPGAFEASGYWNGIKTLLESPDLANLLRRHNCMLDVSVPEEFDVYRSLFEGLLLQADTNSMRLLDSRNTPPLCSYHALITDFSPCAFDLAYLERPVLYFLPDMLEWRAGLHEFRELDLSFEEGFGPLFTVAGGLIDALATIAESDFRPAEPYAQRMRDFYPQRDTNNRSRIYHALASV